MSRSLAIAAALILAGTLPACGLTGDLARPDPLWGDGSDLEPAVLPEAGNTGLPDLPDRAEENDADEAEGPPNAEDELLGGV